MFRLGPRMHPIPSPSVYNLLHKRSDLQEHYSRFLVSSFAPFRNAIVVGLASVTHFLSSHLATSYPQLDHPSTAHQRHV